MYLLPNGNTRVLLPCLTPVLAAHPLGQRPSLALFCAEGGWVLTSSRAYQSSLVEGQASGDLACRRRALRPLRPPWRAAAVGRLRRGGREHGPVAVPGGGGATGRRPDCGLGRPRPCPAATAGPAAAAAPWSPPRPGHERLTSGVRAQARAPLLVQQRVRVTVRVRVTRVGLG